MKTKTSLIATAATMALFGVSNGETLVDITGSTAGRSAVHSALIALLDDAPTANPLKYAWADDSSTPASAASKAKWVIYTGSYDPDGEAGPTPRKDYKIRTFWSGSAAGVRDVCQAPQLDGKYLDASTVTVVGGGSRILSPSFAAASADTVSEIGFSDVFQTSTVYTTPQLAVEDEVGIIPFKFFKSEGSQASLTNITPGLFRNLYGTTGEARLDLFTGNNADDGKWVYATGRNADSGTRITTAAEFGLGVFAGMNQWVVDSGGISGENAVVEFVENAGYSSGSDVAALLSCANITGFTEDTGASLVGYVGSSDWSKVVGGTELAYNGVTLGDITLAANKAKITEGLYSFWGYLHQFRMSLSGDSLAFYNVLKDQITTNASSELIKVGDMDVARDADGAPIYSDH